MAEFKRFVRSELAKQQIKKGDLATKAGIAESTLLRLMRSSSAQLRTLCNVAGALGYRLTVVFEPL